MFDGSNSEVGILDWLTKPMEAPDPSDGLSPLGLLGAALQDFGAAQQGGQGSALDNFAQRQRNAAWHQRINAGAPMAKQPVYGLQRIGTPSWPPRSPYTQI